MYISSVTEPEPGAWAGQYLVHFRIISGCRSCQLILYVPARPLNVSRDWSSISKCMNACLLEHNVRTLEVWLLNSAMQYLDHHHFLLDFRVLMYIISD